MKQKVKEQILNKVGVLTASQRKKIELTIRLLDELPVVDEQMRAKQYHQLTLKEFKAIYSRSIIEEVAPQFIDKSIREILESVSAAALERKLNEILSTARCRYFEIIMNALEQKMHGIPGETINEVRFLNHFFKPTRSYLNFYKEEYKSFL
jgi:hypothetical protein